MSRRRKRFRPDPDGLLLERRELLSGTTRSLVGAEASGAIPRTLQPSHRVVLAGYVFDSALLRLTRDRIAASGNSTGRLSLAFRAFAQNALHQPQTPLPLGTAPEPPTLSTSLDILDRQTRQALTVLEFTTSQLQPSVRNGPRIAPRVGQALIPFAQEQLASLRAYYAANPPAFNADGIPTSQVPLSVLNATYNRILNAVAENSVHPELFRSPQDYYVNPDSTFTIDFDTAPAQGASGYFVRGPRGVPLTGVPHHPTRR